MRYVLDTHTLLWHLGNDPRLGANAKHITVNHLSSQLDIHDSIIVATALQCRDSFEEEIALLTNDTAITQSGLIPVIW